MRACNQTRTSAYIKLQLGESVPEISIGASGIFIYIVQCLHDFAGLDLVSHSLSLRDAVGESPEGLDG